MCAPRAQRRAWAHRGDDKAEHISEFMTHMSTRASVRVWVRRSVRVCVCLNKTLAHACLIYMGKIMAALYRTYEIPIGFECGGFYRF